MARKAERKADKEFDAGRLSGAMHAARVALRPFREQRREMIRQYAGDNYSEEGAPKPVPVNILALYVNIVSRNLIAQNPRFLLSTFDRASRAAVRGMEGWGNRQVQEMNLQMTLARVVKDALFSLGCLKVSLASPADAATSGWNLTAGQPCASRVSLDDLVFDTTARDLSEVAYVGHRFRAPKKAAAFLLGLKGQAAEDLPADPPSRINPEGDERALAIGRGYTGGDLDELEDEVELWEVYLPRHRLVVTFRDGTLGNETADRTKARPQVLRVQPWLGPACGPYHFLAFDLVPDNAMPKGPAQDVYDLHMAYNRLWRKLIDQSDNQKSVLPVRDDADANRINEASDGDAVRVDGEPPKAVDYRGPNAVNAQFASGMWEVFNRLAGNLEMMGGLAPQSKTLGQDKLLEANASRSVADMQDTTINFTSAVGRALCWFWWHHPQEVMRSHFQVPGSPGQPGVRTVTPQQRAQGQFEDLQIDVDPYSLQHQTPQGRMQAVVSVVQKIFAPMAQQAERQGVSIDVSQLFTMIGRLANIPELTEVLTTVPPPNQDQPPGSPGGPDGAAGGAAPPTMPQQTSREYIRRSLGGQTPQGREAEVMNAMSAAAANGDGK